jgi:hypothetical protein
MKASFPKAAVSDGKPGYKKVGVIKDVKQGEIIIGGSNIADKVNMGDRLKVMAGNSIVVLSATFPMASIVLLPGI